MSMTETLRNFERNPQTPKKIQIPFTTFLAVEMLLQEIDVATLSKDAQMMHYVVCKELAEKKDRVRNRQAYTAIIHAQSEDEKQAAYENYRLTKGMSL